MKEDIENKLNIVREEIKNKIDSKINEVFKIPDFIGLILIILAFLGMVATPIICVWDTWTIAWKVGVTSVVIWVVNSLYVHYLMKLKEKTRQNLYTKFTTTDESH